MKKRNWLTVILLTAAMVICPSIRPVAAATVNEIESNDSIAAAQSISLNDEIYAEITDGDEADFYRIQVPTGKLTIDLRSYIEYYSFALFNEEGERIWKDENNHVDTSVGFRKESLIMYLNAGTYYFRVNGATYVGNEQRYIGEYVFTAYYETIQTDETEPNNTLEQATPVNSMEAFTGICSEDDTNDFFRIRVSEAGLLSLAIKSFVQSSCYRFYDVNGTELWKKDGYEIDASVGFRNETFGFYLEPGDYFLQVRGSYFINNDPTSKGSYTVTPSFTALNTNEYEPNNSLADATLISFDEQINAIIAEGGDIDFYRFNLTGTTLYVDMAFNMERYALEIYDESGSSVKDFSYNSPSSDSNFSRNTNEVELAPGQYYLKVVGSINSVDVSDFSGEYSFKLRQTDSHVPVMSLEIDRSQLSLRAGEQAILKATVGPENATNKAVTWTSSNTSVASVSSGGVVTANSKGTATITVTAQDGSASAACTVSVSDPVVSVHGITLSRTELSLKTGDQYSLQASVNPANATDHSVSWHSSNTSVASVSSSGVVTAKGKGTATITVTSNDGGISASCTVTVTSPAVVNKFNDIKPGTYYYDAVLWAVENNITSGTSSTTFSPSNNCNRAQAVTFLWKLAGSPKVSVTNPFRDVKSSDYFYNAVMWAISEGVSTGTTPTTFSPYNICNRAQIVTLMYRYEGEPYVSGRGFSDVPDNMYFADPVKWALSKGITTGTTPTTFKPYDPCTRGHIVTFLYRYVEGN